MGRLIPPPGPVLAPNAPLALLERFRAAAGDLLRARAETLDTRLWALARLADRCDPLIAGRVTTRNDQHFEDEIARTRDPRYFADAERARPAAADDGEFAFLLGQQLFVAVARLPALPSGLRRLLERVYSSYRAAHGPDLPADVLWRDFLARRARWTERFGREIAEYLERFALNHWMRIPAEERPDRLFAHQRRLMLSVAMLRVLLFQHPDLALSAPLDRERLERAVVECCYAYCRAVLHTPELETSLQELLRANGLDSLEQMVRLLGV
jgi:hypothetical protein